MKIGWVEWLSLPELKVSLIKAKIDTGARTSALHTFKIEPFQKDSNEWVRFWVHPNQDDSLNEVVCECPLKDQRSVTNSGGSTESRYVIETLVKIADKSWPIEITLTNRDEMKFRMLLGRQAMQDLEVQPSRQYIQKRPKKD
jgi:hypothetical protein